MNKSCRLFWGTPGIIIRLGFFSFLTKTKKINNVKHNTFRINFMQGLLFNLVNIKKNF